MAGLHTGTRLLRAAVVSGLAGVALAFPPLCLSDTAQFKVLDSFRVGEDVYVRSLAAETAAGALWVGTSGGVLEIELETLQPRNVFTRADGLANEYIFAIGLDSRGYKWFGTNAGGVSRFRAGEWRTFFPMHGLADYWVYAFAEQPGGTWWIGTWDGVNRVNLETLAFETFRSELVNEWVYGIAVDSQSKVWFATEGGVTMYDGDGWRHWTHADGIGAEDAQRRPVSRNTGLGTRNRHDLSVLEYGAKTFNPNYVFAVHADARDRIWAGTWGGGVAVYEEGAWRNYTTADGLAGNLVYCILEEPENVFWFGTDRGVSRFDGTRWQLLTVADGLLGNHVYALTATESGEIWAGTRNGVVRIGRGD